MKNPTNKKPIVFLGGTCNNSLWRNKLIPKLKINWFNPVVADWTPACQKEEIKQRKTADFVLYVITPKMTGVYSIAEVVDDSIKQPKKTLFCVLPKDGTNKFNDAQLKSLKATENLIKKNGAKVFNNLDEIADYLNKQK